MPQSIDINRIVENVLDQIAQEAREKGTGTGNNIRTNRPIASTAASDCNETGEELFVADRVVSLARIERQLAGKRRLVITPGAILTPSVRDYLKEHRISICTAVSDKPGPTNGPPSAQSGMVTIVAARTSYNPTSLVNRLLQQRFNVTAENFDCLIETTDRLAEQLADPDRLGVILTSHHAATLCLANRHKNLRAVYVDCENQLEPIVTAVGANVLIVTPRGRPAYQLEQIVTRFLRMPHEKHTCPEVLKSRLA